ncbi:hypothetical protein NDI37_08780 [Funiculus sociatus GB2-A5]|uniref:Uncharacterized protein n=1 Tax=Funiculus sociatus GB2-A5 TaxID=2933946 RepID=A0ABV0JPI6_9CYAN|nr:MULTISPECIES: hypothetical protein [unclassified Trichocoleus]MBD1904928.1 hypothetical protein [Trichocoleus sp. FACHB-832]MBD2064688.1 hypothetical protein [Trichocoleus sp. FACHB-6]
MSCPHSNNCKLRKIATENKAICLTCGSQFRLEEIDFDSSAGSILATLVVAAIVLSIVTGSQQQNSVTYELEPSKIEVNSDK